eukprot:13441875-Alexandrium_andersonii.AAC.1
MRGGAGHGQGPDDASQGHAQRCAKAGHGGEAAALERQPQRGERPGQAIAAEGQGREEPPQANHHADEGQRQVAWALGVLRR